MEKTLHLITINEAGTGKTLRKFITLAINSDEAIDNFRKVNQEETEAGEPLVACKKGYSVSAMPIMFEREIYDV
jgi:hypothetical protein